MSARSPARPRKPGKESLLARLLREGKGGSDVFGPIDYDKLSRKLPDYAPLAFNAAGGAEVNYVIGTMALLADPTLVAISPTVPGPFPGMAANPDTIIDPTTGVPRVGGPLPGFTAKEVMLSATQNCLVRFDEPVRGQAELELGVLYTYTLKTFRIYAVGSTPAAGILRIYATGL